MSEIKYVVEGENFSLDSSAGYIVDLSPEILQGVTKNQRIGDKIKYKRFSLRIDVRLTNKTNSADYTSYGMRVAIVQPRVALDDPISLINIFDSDTNWMSTIKGTAVRVLWDKIMPVSLNGEQAQHAFHMSRFIRKKVFRLNNNVTFRDGTEETPTDWKDTYYMIVLTSNLGTANIAQIDGSYFTRFSYIDV